MNKQEFTKNIDELGQVYTVGAWIGENTKVGGKMRFTRFLYIHSKQICLDMRDDRDFIKFKTMIELGDEVSRVVSTMPMLQDMQEGRDNIYAIPVFKDDLMNFNNSPKIVKEF